MPKTKTKTTITTSIPQSLPEMSLYQYFSMKMEGDTMDGFDICDKDWDWGVYVTCEKDAAHCADGYDRFMLLICLNIICESKSKDWYSPCRVAEFIWNNRVAFRKFFNKHNREGYRPKDYNKIAPDRDTGFYEAYIVPLESMIDGNYSDSDYDEMCELLSPGWVAVAKAERDAYIANHPEEA